MKLGSTLADFFANPFDPNGDGKTSVSELFLCIGLIGVMTIAWKFILNKTFEASA